MSEQEVKLFRYGRYWEEAFRMAVEKIERARVLLALDQDAVALAELQEPVGEPDIDFPPAPPPGDSGLREALATELERIAAGTHGPNLDPDMGYFPRAADRIIALMAASRMENIVATLAPRKGGER